MYVHMYTLTQASEVFTIILCMHSLDGILQKIETSQLDLCTSSLFDGYVLQGEEEEKLYYIIIKFEDEILDNSNQSRSGTLFNCSNATV